MTLKTGTPETGREETGSGEMLFELPLVEGGTAPESLDVEAARIKLERLRAYLEQRMPEGVVVAFSGGVDSAFLLWAAEDARRSCGGRLVALTTLSPSMSQVDRADARRFALSLGVDHVWRESQEFSSDDYLRNDRQRCYHCKAELFRIAGSLARERGCRWILYGYNDSDRGDVRPGHRAALEHGVLAPLADVALGKNEIRWLLHEHGLELADKPASPCLSSRVMTGVRITEKVLDDVEVLEAILRRGGLRVFRVRICSEGAILFIRLEVPPSEMAQVLEHREELVEEARRRGYRWVTLDLDGYRMGGGVA